MIRCELRDRCVRPSISFGQKVTIPSDRAPHARSLPRRNEHKGIRFCPLIARSGAKNKRREEKNTPKADDGGGGRKKGVIEYKKVKHKEIKIEIGDMAVGGRSPRRAWPKGGKHIEKE